MDYRQTGSRAVQMIKGIASQKKYATTIYDQLIQNCARVKLAGGAPRDWFYGKLATDLDFYVYSESDWVVIDNTRYIAEPLNYQNTNYVYETLPRGTKLLNYSTQDSQLPPCQIFLLPDLESLFTYVPKGFDLSISQITYNFHIKGSYLCEYSYTENFGVTCDTGIIFPTKLELHEDSCVYDPSPEHKLGFENYVEKIKARYPYTHKFGTVYDALHSLWHAYDNC